MVIKGKGQLDSFTQVIKQNSRYYSELLSIMAYMEIVANLKLLPLTKFRDISPKSERAKEYEFKSKHLRIYAFHLEENGKIVIMGGFKNTQAKDIKQFRMIKKRFLNTRL
ncbi:MAG: hypothetical protein ACKOW2_07130 [Sphingobacteriaceae bacterium]